MTGRVRPGADIARNLHHADATGRAPEVVFADSARRAAVPPYVDNRQVYGCAAPRDVALSPQALEAARRLIATEVNARAQRLTAQRTGRSHRACSTASPRRTKVLTHVENHYK